MCAEILTRYFNKGETVEEIHVYLTAKFQPTQTPEALAGVLDALQALVDKSVEDRPELWEKDPWSEELDAAEDAGFFSAPDVAGGPFAGDVERLANAFR